MEMNAFWLSLPAIIAFSIKIILLFYAQKSPVQNKETRLFLYFLFVLALQNIAEIFVFYTGQKGIIPNFEAFTYFAISIAALSLLVHLTLALTTNITITRKNFILVAMYSYAGMLETLLIFTPLLIVSFVPFGFTFTRTPGPLYVLFEIFAISSFVGIIALLIYGSVKQYPKQKRIKCQYLLLGLLPMAVLIITTVIMLKLEIRWFNSTITLPIAITFFLIVTAYATHKHRLFDIQFYIPWSKVRKRKTAFYDRIRAMVAEIADLGSASKIIDRLANTLRCPAALVGGNKPILALADGSQNLARFPLDELHNCDHIIVANEIADTMPALSARMKHHNVAAIVPFYPHSQHAASWLLLGDSFSEQVYTPLDFRIVEQLFDKIADLFLDKLLTMRTQLATAHNQIRALETKQLALQANHSQLLNENQTLRQQNAQLIKERPSDSIGQKYLEAEAMPGMVTLLGRDKSVLKMLRKQYPQTVQFVSPDSSGFKQQPLPDALVCKLDNPSGSTLNKLLTLFAENRGKTAIVLYGPDAANFVDSYKSALVGHLIEFLPEYFSEELLIRKVRALVPLSKHTYSLSHPDSPLIGQSHSFADVLTEARRVASFMEPVIIVREDNEDAISLARYIHDLSQRGGNFSFLRTAQILPEKIEEGLTSQLSECHDGTLMIESLFNFPKTVQEILLIESNKQNVRLIAGCSHSVDSTNEALFRGRHVFKLEMPWMRERKTDIPLLVHYFTLQFNLQAGTNQYPSQSEVDNFMATDYPKNISALKSFVFDLLKSKQPKVSTTPDFEDGINDKTLDDHVAEFEASILKKTLKRCNGNKSRAARLLGIRPNTLHYKLERCGLAGEKKK